ncbi:MAG: hypothetical protein D6765_16905 [Bacteroidetes bacterium]|nr:MAG: hypothetical protein D6765_16905 [Bacteroidota bacterium]
MRLFIVFFVSVILVACNAGDEGGAESPAPEPASQSPEKTSPADAGVDFTKIEGEGQEILFFHPEELQLVNHRRIPLRPEGWEDATMVILVPEGEEDPDAEKTSLTHRGRAQAARLANIMGGAELTAIYWYNNTSMQTGFYSSRANECELLNYFENDLDLLLKTLLTSYMGKRIMVVGNRNSIPKMLNRITGTTAFQPLPEDDRDVMFVALFKDFGKAKVYQLKMYALH